MKLTARLLALCALACSASAQAQQYDKIGFFVGEATPTIDCGAGVVTMVEQDRRTAALISRNAAALGFSRARVVAGSVGAFLASPPAAPYDVVFSDPPYPMSDADVDADLVALVTHGWLVPGALVVVERAAKRTVVTWPGGIEADRTKRYGETALWYGHATPAP